MDSTTTTRREQLADAAITTLAQAGMRGLTHRAVDAAAGVATGSTSYYFRSRQSLLEAAIARLAEVDAAEVARQPELAEGAQRQEVAAALARLVRHAVTAGRERMLARYELSLEANRRPELRAVLVGEGAALRRRAERLLAAAGAPDPPMQAPLLVAFLDGLIFDHVAGAGALELSTGEIRAAFEDMLAAFTPPGPARRPRERDRR